MVVMLLAVPRKSTYSAKSDDNQIGILNSSKTGSFLDQSIIKKKSCLKLVHSRESARSSRSLAEFAVEAGSLEYEGNTCPDILCDCLDVANAEDDQMLEARNHLESAYKILSALGGECERLSMFIDHTSRWLEDIHHSSASDFV